MPKLQLRVTKFKITGFMSNGLKYVASKVKMSPF